MRDVIQRRFKNRGVLDLCRRVLEKRPGGGDVGLPIGALTSQFFANSYLDVVDRYLRERLRVRAYVRYMDDLLWWCDSLDEARAAWRRVSDFAALHRALVLKPPRICPSTQGVAFLGFRILPGVLRLSRRRRRRYAEARSRWETKFGAGDIDALTLQRGYDAARAITGHASATAWRRTQLHRVPWVDQ
jgi:hypothetical protein